MPVLHRFEYIPANFVETLRVSEQMHRLCLNQHNILKRVFFSKCKIPFEFFEFKNSTSEI